MVMKKNTNNTN